MLDALVAVFAVHPFAIAWGTEDLSSSWPGTIVRYIVESETIPGQIEIALVWRGTVMPDERKRQQALEDFRRALADVLDWDTAQYNNGQVLMHT